MERKSIKLFVLDWLLSRQGNHNDDDKPVITVDDIIEIILDYNNKLPDRCILPNCGRKGIRGNEYVIWRNGKKIIICDYCLLGMYNKPLEFK